MVLCEDVADRHAAVGELLRIVGVLPVPSESSCSLDTLQRSAIQQMRHCDSRHGETWAWNLRQSSPRSSEIDEMKLAGFLHVKWQKSGRAIVQKCWIWQNMRTILLYLCNLDVTMCRVLYLAWSCPASWPKCSPWAPAREARKGTCKGVSGSDTHFNWTPCLKSIALLHKLKASQSYKLHINGLCMYVYDSYVSK